MRRVAVALMLALAACGGGGGTPKAAPTTPAATTARPVPPEAQRIRDAAKKTLAACPCSFRVWVSAFGGPESYDVRLRGVYDPAMKSISYTEERVKELQARAVDGTVYVLVGGSWRRLDASGLPAPVKSALAPMALADPAVFFAFGSGVASATPKVPSPLLHDVEYDMAAVLAAAGPYADLLRRMIPGESVYESVKVAKDGTLQQVSFMTSGDDASVVHASYEVLALHQKAAPVAAPAGAQPIDLATFSV